MRAVSATVKRPDPPKHTLEKANRFLAVGWDEHFALICPQFKLPRLASKQVVAFVFPKLYATPGTNVAFPIMFSFTSVAVSDFRFLL
jgi:hypothetical protein